MSENTAVKDDIRSAAATQKCGEDAAGPDRLAASIEAILLSVDKPVSIGRLAGALGLASAPERAAGDAKEPRSRKKSKGEQTDGSESATGLGRIEAAVDQLNEIYQSSGRSFRIERVAGGYRIMSLAAFAPVLAAFHGSRAGGRLGKAAVETLSIIAYK